MSDLPLAGRRILVTRAAHQAGKLSDALRALGAEPVEVPVLEIRPPASYDPLDRALRQPQSYDWIVFTSANAVRAWVERIAALGIAFKPPSSLKVAAVGAATATAAREGGFSITFVPESYVAESLVKGLLTGHHNESGHDFSRAEKAEDEKRALSPEENFAGKRILVVRAAIARDVIPDALCAAGAQANVVVAYRNVVPKSAPALLREALARKIDAATFTSSSSVTHLAEAALKAGIDIPFPGVPAISIGPITSQTLCELDWPPAAEAAVSDIPGLVNAVVSLFAGR